MGKSVKTYEINENILRVVCTMKDEVMEPVMVERQPAWRGMALIGADTRQEDHAKILGNGSLLIEQTGFTMEPKEIMRYTFEGDKPKVVTKKTVDGERSFVENATTKKVGDAYGAAITFSIEGDEAIYGLGQHENGIYNYRGVKEYLYHNNMKIPMPVFLSSKNYAIFFDCASMMTYEERDNTITVTLDAVDQIDYYVIFGACFDDLIAGIRRLTGRAVMLPKWTFGYIQSKERYKTQEEILETAAEFAKRDIPLGCIVLDWLSWENGKWGNMIFDKSRFPDARAMVSELHKQGVAFMISVWPNRKEGCENHEEFARAGKLLCNNSNYDAFDAEARDIYWRQCERELYPAGIDAWWCDSSEPFTPDWNGEVKRPDEERYQMAKESTNKYLDARNSNLHPVMHALGIYEHQRAADKTKRVCNLTRAGYPGIQKYGTILWSGDIAATWQVYRSQIAEGLSMGLSGNPYWTLDAGAFFAGNTKSWRRWANIKEETGVAPWFWHGDYEDGVEDLGYRELYTRWLQLAAFLPIMRSHGTDTPREPWQFGEEGSEYYDTIVKYIKLRYKLLPYTYSLAAQVVQGDYTLMRSLMFDFGNQDEAVKTIHDEYMYGPSFLVAPVMEPFFYGPNSTPLDKEPVREVYLPKGANWFDYDTMEYYEGGQKIKTAAGIERIPVFVRAGSIIPVSEHGDGEADTLEIYAGEHGLFVLYLDNGTDYSYENGDYASVPIVWNDAERVIAFGEKVGRYDAPQRFKVRIYNVDGAVKEHEVTYEGKEKVVKL